MLAEVDLSDKKALFRVAMEFFRKRTMGTFEASDRLLGHFTFSSSETFEGNFKRKYLERVKLSRGTVKTKNDQQKFLFLLKINFRVPFKSSVVL